MTAHAGLYIPQSRLLVLTRGNKRIRGKIGGRLGDGDDGAVFVVQGSWPSVKGKLIAKWFKHKMEGTTELENLEFLGELLDYGIDSTPSFWAILERKKGDILEKLPSYLRERQRPAASCKGYMMKVREAIVEAHIRYLRKAGAPYHGYVLTGFCTRLGAA